MLYLLFFLIAIAAIWIATWQAKLREQVERRAELERDIIRSATLCAGRITALDVKTRVPNAIDAIEECLRKLHRQGYCESEVTSDGRHLYIFGAFDDAPQRARALEKVILRIAQIHDGIVRVPAVVLDTELSYLEVRALLDGMAQNGICWPLEEPDAYWFSTPGGGARPASRSLTPHGVVASGDEDGLAGGAEGEQRGTGGRRRLPTS